MQFKDIIREVFIFLHIDLTKNLKYDRLTKAIIKKHVRSDSNCIDVGCHKGEILLLLQKHAPKGEHVAFEPIPYLYESIKEKFTNNVTVYPYALSDKNGTTEFQLVKNAPAYSGIKKRKYAVKSPDIEEIQVEMKQLDDLIPLNKKIDFVKIDVEGGEFEVLKGGQRTFNKNKPIILFECGKGASDYYGTEPEEIYHFINNEIGLKVYTLKSFKAEGLHLSKGEFTELYETNEEYYFVASPTAKK